jgi:hypothetical protein
VSRGRLAQLVRAPALQAGGRRFEPCTAHHPSDSNSRGDVVQLVRTLPCHGRGREFESRRPRHSFEGVTGRDTENFNPQFNPQLSVHCGAHPHGGQEFALCGPRFIAVFLRIQIGCGLNLAVTQDSLNDFLVGPSICSLASCLVCDTNCEVRTVARDRPTGPSHQRPSRNTPEIRQFAKSVCKLA